MPKNLSVKENRNISSKYDVTVSWAKPELQPSFHQVEVIRLKPETSNLTKIEVDGVS
jgi:hypothetical protein